MQSLINHPSAVTVEEIKKNIVEELWMLCNKPGETFPKTWPVEYDQFRKWALGRAWRKNSMGTDEIKFNLRCIVKVPFHGVIQDLPAEQTLDEQVAGIICTDLVTDENQEYYPGSEIGDINISYMTFDGHRSRGVATIAVKAMVDFLQCKDRFPVLRIAEGNEASLSVAKRNGFVVINKVEIVDALDNSRQSTNCKEPGVLPKVIQILRLPQDPLATVAIDLSETNADEHFDMGLGLGLLRAKSVQNVT